MSFSSESDRSSVNISRKGLVMSAVKAVACSPVTGLDGFPDVSVNEDGE